MDLERISKKSVHKVLEEGAKEAESYLVRVRSLTAYIDDDRVKNLEENLDRLMRELQPFLAAAGRE